MHRAATPSRAAVRLAVHLGHDLGGGDPSHQRLTVLAIGRHDVVVFPERMHRADAYGLFADVEVQEPADLLFRIELRALFLEPADADHIPQQLERMLT